MSEYPIAVALYLDTWTKDTLEHLKRSEGFTINGFIRKAIAEKLRRMGMEHRPEIKSPTT